MYFFLEKLVPQPMTVDGARKESVSTAPSEPSDGQCFVFPLSESLVFEGFICMSPSLDGAARLRFGKKMFQTQWSSNVIRDNLC